MEKIILLVDDEENIRKDLGEFLQKKGFGVHKAASAQDARKIILSEHINYAIIDLKIDFESEFGGIDIINFLKRMQPRAKIIVLSAYSIDGIESKLEVELDSYIYKGAEGNYILNVSSEIEKLEKTIGKKTCFVIMPFSDSNSCSEEEWTEIYKNVIKPAVEDSGYNYACKRSEALYGNIIEGILDELNRADMVIADLTDKNPNVYYELGVRHALRDTTILLAQRIEDIPFDLKPYATQVYKWKTKPDRLSFKKKIKSIIKYIEDEPEKMTSPVRKYLKL